MALNSATTIVSGAAFLEALNSYDLLGRGRVGSEEDFGRKIAAFFGMPLMRLDSFLI